MVGKNNKYVMNKKMSDKKKQFTLKKLSIGLVSLAAGTSLMFAAPNEVVQADEDDHTELDYDDDFADDDYYEIDDANDYYEADDADDYNEVDDADDYDDVDDADDYYEVDDADDYDDVDDAVDYNEVDDADDYDDVDDADDYNEVDDAVDDDEDDDQDDDIDDEDDDDEDDDEDDDIDDEDDDDEDDDEDDDIDDEDDDQDDDIDDEDDDDDDIDDEDDDDAKYLRASVSRQDALRTALADAGLSDKDINLDDLELEDAVSLVYVVEFSANGRDYEYDIDANSGEIISKEVDFESKDRDDLDDMDDDHDDLDDVNERDDQHDDVDDLDDFDDDFNKNNRSPQESNNAKADIISREEALKIALEHSKAYTSPNISLDELELDNKDGRQVYEIEFNINNQKFEYDIDAVTGEIIEAERDGQIIKENKSKNKQSVNKKAEEKDDQKQSVETNTPKEQKTTETSIGQNNFNQTGQKENFTNEVTRQFHDLVNAERQSKGLQPLAYNTDGLQTAANIRTEEIISSFSHTRPNGQKFNTASGFESMGTTTGENIQQTYAKEGATASDLAQELFNNWKNSPGHYKNMMSDKYTKQSIGLKFVDNGQYVEVYSSQNFSN